MNERALIFANGELKSPQIVKGMITADDFLIAADGGAKRILELGLKPALVIGDMDSLSRTEAIQLEALGAEMIRYSMHKDETDLELAILHAARHGYKNIRIIAGLGGRLDQTLGNIFLLMMEEVQNIDIRMDDGVEEVFLVQSEREIEGKAGDIVSLIPLKCAAYGVTTKDLWYPLNKETLYQEKTRGISNIMREDKASVSLENGLLLCIHSRK